MSSPFDFYTFDSFFTSRHSDYFIIENFNSNGDNGSSISKIADVSDVHTYIIDKYKEKNSGLKSRKIKVSLDSKKVLHLLQTTTYESYISYKLYKVYSSESSISKLKKLIYDTDFKNF
jgi:hypothetical protein